MAVESTGRAESDHAFDPDEWAKKSFPEQVEIACQNYILKGLNIPFPAYAFHALKIVALFFGWVFFCSFTPGLGSLREIGTWAFDPTAFQKAFIWSMTYEALGMGCMSGPLGIRLWPPFTAFIQYLRPGATKLPLFPGAPIIGGTRRTILDVLLYAAFIGSAFYVLVQPEITRMHLLPVVALLPLCALGDRVIFLSARGEHHFAMVVAFFFAGNWIAASKWVQLAIWFWAGVSKLTVAFSYVVPIMTANNPFMKSAWFRRKLFKSYPNDLSPSRLGKVMAHMGTFLEFGTPIALLFVTQEGPLLFAGIAMMVMLHGFILSNMPLAAVFEWNILSLYSGFFLFYFNPEVSLFAVDSTPMTIYLIIGCLIVPLIGNLVPRWVSFLLAMRYYAGNWAWNAWIFKKGSEEKLNKLKRVSELYTVQLRRFMTPVQATESESLFIAFRVLHLQGRVLGMLLPQAIDNGRYQDYLVTDGEQLTASIIGWNFGEGHLGDEKLLRAIQEQCDFEEGEVRVICVEAQPILGSSLHWRINDAKTGKIAEGYAELSDLAKRNPWDYGEF